ncbi:MAG: hypothetical protein QM765_10805 [Myxococcales bacterium]
MRTSLASLATLLTLALSACGGPSAPSPDGGTPVQPGGDAGSTLPTATGSTFPDKDATNGLKPEESRSTAPARCAWSTPGSPTWAASIPFATASARPTAAAPPPGPSSPWATSGFSGGHAHLAVGADGKAHLVWTRATSILNGGGDVLYATCASGCTSAAAWQSGVLISDTTANLLYEVPAGPSLAVDSKGRPRFLLKTPAVSTQYAACDADCTQAASWTFTELSSHPTVGASLAFFADAPRIAYVDGLNATLYFRQCETGCTSAASWTAETPMFWAENGHLELRLTSAGKPRLVYNQGTSGASDSAVTANDWKTFYGSCENNCTAAEQWTVQMLPLEAHQGEYGLALALRRNGTPVVAFENNDTGVSQISCSSGCEAVGSSWTTQAVDTSDTVQAQIPAPLPNCTTGTPKAFWYPGENVRVALDGNDRPRFVFETYTLQQCSISGSVTEGVRLARYAQ